ncbi:MAG TPA: SMI1/KNR4 family protein [Planctomycetaceae bacterium]|nr:SMI1/KNR4 family protein [Planctomycetaceae bacterium]
MTVEFSDSFPMAEESSLSRFEQKFKTVLPYEYRSFLLRQNGGFPLNDVLFHVPELNEDVMLAMLYGVSDIPSQGTIEFEINDILEDLKGLLLPIGHDPGGNSILLGLKEEFLGRVYYWDSSYFFETSDDDLNTYLISETFNEFIDNLTRF